MATIAELAPTLISLGFSAQELKSELRPRNVSSANVPPIQKKRYEKAIKLLSKHPELTNKEIAAQVTTITEEIVATLRTEVEAVVSKLSGLDPVNTGTDSDKEIVSATLNGSTNRVVKNKHGLDDGNKVNITNIVGSSGIESGEYFVVNANANNFQISLTENGTVIDFTSNGTCDYLIIG